MPCADRYYYYYNSGLQQQYVLYGQDSLTAEPVVLLDPNSLSDDGTVALKDAVFSDNGQLMAYSLSSGGSDWSTIKVTTGAPSSLLFIAQAEQSTETSKHDPDVRLARFAVLPRCTCYIEFMPSQLVLRPACWLFTAAVDILTIMIG